MSYGRSTGWIKGFLLLTAVFASFAIQDGLAIAADKNQQLLEAAETGQAEDVQRLLGEGASCNAKDKDNRETPLIRAARFGQTEVVRVLIDKKV